MAAVAAGLDVDNCLQSVVTTITGGCTKKTEKLLTPLKNAFVTRVSELQQCERSHLESMGIPAFWADLLLRQVE